MNTFFNAGDNKVAQSVQMCQTSRHEKESWQDINVHFAFTVTFLVFIP